MLMNTSVQICSISVNRQFSWQIFLFVAPIIPMFPWNLCVHLYATALMTPGVKSMGITSLKTSNVSMDVVFAFDSPIRLTTASKAKNVPVCMNQELNLRLSKR